MKTPMMKFNCADPTDPDKKLIHPGVEAQTGCQIILEELEKEPFRWTMTSEDMLTTYVASAEANREIENFILQTRKNNAVTSRYPAEIVVNRWTTETSRKRIWMITRNCNSQSEQTKINERYMLVEDVGAGGPIIKEAAPGCSIGSPAHINYDSVWIREPETQEVLAKIEFSNPIWPWALFYPKSFLALAKLQNLHDLRCETALQALSKDSSSTTRSCAKQHQKDAMEQIGKITREIINLL